MSIISARHLIITSVIGILSVTSASAVELISNGGFKIGSVTPQDFPTYDTITSGGQQDLSGWTVGPSALISASVIGGLNTGEVGRSYFTGKYRVLSYAMARLKADNNTPWGDSDDKLRARLALGGRDHHLVEPSGSWVRHTEMEIAKRDGDRATLERLEAEQERIMGTVSEHIGAALAKTRRESDFPSPPVTPDPASEPPQERGPSARALA